MQPGILLRTVLRNNAVSNLCRYQLFFLLKLIGHQRFINTHCTVRSMIVFETTIKTLVSKAAIAMAITRWPRNPFRNLAAHSIGVFCLSVKFLWRKNGPETRLCWCYFKMSRNPKRLGLRFITRMLMWTLGHLFTVLS